MTSTLVETISLNAEDFTEHFLTCGTCLSAYDSRERTPKLLPCSHTVCKSCLERIAASGRRPSSSYAPDADTGGSFRCPICRETIPLPRGGVASLPPSFIVNQLLDLMHNRRRDVIPTCGTHTGSELLFCETCDSVFCPLCSARSPADSEDSEETMVLSHGHGATSDHTVIPFSVAIKRMSEILLFKANQCIGNLGRAEQALLDEISRLDANTEATMAAINRSFEALQQVLNKRRQRLIEDLLTMKERKRRVLADQLAIIQAEKAKVERECSGLQYQIEVRNITQRINDLNEKIDATRTLSEPRENCFLFYDCNRACDLELQHSIEKQLEHFGRLRTSFTFPSLSELRLEAKALPSVFIQCKVILRTVDYCGKMQTTGGDPVRAELNTPTGDKLDCLVLDRNDGNYWICFRPTGAGKHCLNVKIFDRHVSGLPLYVEISEHINPCQSIGCFGSGDLEFNMPTDICVTDDDKVHVIDTGNSRVVVMSLEGKFIRTIEDTSLQLGGTGISAMPGGFAVVNWRTREVIRFDRDGEFVSKFTCDVFKQPIALAVTSRMEFVIADNGTNCVYMCDSRGQLLRTLTGETKEGKFSTLCSVCVGARDEIVVADPKSLWIFSSQGKLLHLIRSDAHSAFKSVTVDVKGRIVATRIEKGRNYIQVYNYDGKPLFLIDSFDDRLKRPNGLATSIDGRLYVTDLGMHSIKVFRYE